MSRMRRLVAVLVVCCASGSEFAALAGVSGAVLGAATMSAQAAETLKIERRRVRPRVTVRREVYVRPVFRTNHLPGVWRGDVRLPWVGPGICHDARTSGRVYCILW